MLWIYYAFLKSHTTLLITINSFGVFIETVYICFFLFYATKKARIDAVKLLLLFIVAGFGLVLLLTLFLVKGTNRTHVVGWICLVFSLCVFVAPLCIVKKVIQTKSVEYMPFALSAFLTLSAVVWFFYGLLIKDFNVAIPNVLGFTFGIIQMVLYQIYNKSEKVAKEKKRSADGLADQIIIVDEHKLSDNKADQQVIDMTKLGSQEKIPVVLRRDGAAEDSPEMLKDLNNNNNNNNFEIDIHQTKMIAA